MKAPAWLSWFVRPREGSSSRASNLAPSETRRATIESAARASNGRRMPTRIGRITVEVPIRSVITGDLEMRSVELERVAELLEPELRNVRGGRSPARRKVSA